MVGKEVSEITAGWVTYFNHSIKIKFVDEAGHKRAFILDRADLYDQILREGELKDTELKRLVVKE